MMYTLHCTIGVNWDIRDRFWENGAFGSENKNVKTTVSSMFTFP